MKFFLSICFIVLSITIFVFPQNNETASKNNEIARLKPSEFKPSKHCPKMPLRIVSYLDNLGCTIPQSTLTKNHHNAFQGEFVKSGQFDWAVLCSRNNFSSILMFWNSQTKHVSEFAKFPDSASRAIGKDTLQHLSGNDQKLYAEVFPKLSSWGIDEITPDHKSVIYYIYNYQLLVLENDVRN